VTDINAVEVERIVSQKRCLTPNGRLEKRTSQRERGMGDKGQEESWRPARIKAGDRAGQERCASLPRDPGKS
jgi:hypothetical protein